VFSPFTHRACAAHRPWSIPRPACSPTSWAVCRTGACRSMLQVVSAGPNTVRRCCAVTGSGRLPPSPAAGSRRRGAGGLTPFRPRSGFPVPVDRAWPPCVHLSWWSLPAGVPGARWAAVFAWLSDEWYLIAGLPPAAPPAYEDLPQQETCRTTPRAFLECPPIRPPAAYTSALAASAGGSLGVAQLVAGASAPVGGAGSMPWECLEADPAIGLTSPYGPGPGGGPALLTGSDLCWAGEQRTVGVSLLLPSGCAARGARLLTT